MGAILTRMPAPEGVAAGQTATFKLPIGLRCHYVLLAFGGTTFDLTHMTEIRVLVNGKVIHRYSATERNAMNMFDGLADAATKKRLVIPFDRFNLKTRVQETLTALNTGSKDEKGVSINNVSIEVDISSSASAPTLSMKALQSEQLPGGPGSMLHIMKNIFNPTAAGEFHISTMAKGASNSQLLNKVIWHPSANAINSFQVELNRKTIAEMDLSDNESIQIDGVRTPQTGYVIYDRTANGVGVDPLLLKPLDDFRYIMDVSGAMTLTMISEYIGNLGS